MWQLKTTELVCCSIALLSFEDLATLLQFIDKPISSSIFIIFLNWLKDLYICSFLMGIFT